MLSIKNYQSNLKYYYGFYTENVDGKVGSKTKSAVKSYQKFKGLTQDGIYGSKTDSALVTDIKIYKLYLIKAEQRLQWME